MKILFLINNLSKGGAEGVFMAEQKALARLGFNTEIFLLYDSHFKNLFDINSYISLIKKIRQENIEIVYSTLDDSNFVAKVVRIFVRFKLFCREANMTEDKSIKFKIADVLLNFLVYKLVMVAEAVKHSYASYDPFHKNKMVVLYNGVEFPTLEGMKEISNPIRILAVGSFTKKKGFEDLVSIFEKYVLPETSDFILDIVGNGPLFNKIQSQIKAAGLGERIKCLGLMEKEDIKKKYQSSDIFVLTSKKEGCPNVLLEAMSYGVPAVCFSVGAVPEIIEQDLSGIVIKPLDKEAFGNAVTSLIQDPKEIKRLGNNARQRIMDNFLFDAHMKNLLKLFELHE